MAKSHDKRHTVYLGDRFFNLSSILSENSQPGVLIHLTAHFNDCLNLDDLNLLQQIETYEKNALKYQSDI